MKLFKARKKDVGKDFLDACRVVWQRQCFITSRLDEDLRLLKDHRDDLERFILDWSDKDFRGECHA